MVVGHWKFIANDDELKRSSHTVSAIDEIVYIFGGELISREPRDNKLFKLQVTADTARDPLIAVTNSGDAAPSPRVGSASATLGGKMYLFSGRGGIAMKPVEESGQLHAYDTAKSTWTVVPPADASAPYPPARSYHCMTSDNDSTLFVHAGCPEKGRLADLWSFNVSTREWTQLPEAPVPQRGGTSIVYADGKLYRMNGFDGKTEQGGSLDIFDAVSKVWSTKTFSSAGTSGPEARSVSALLSVRIDGKTKLVTLFGERDPSSLGHAGAGKMLGDWWVYDIISEKWEQGTNEKEDVPVPRGWFDATELDDRQLVVSGGLSESNERLGDVWLLSL